MKILITGGAGSLGSNIVKRFLAEDIDFVIVDNFETGSYENLKGIPKSKIIEGSILDEILMRSVFETHAPSHIIHSAASYKDPDDFE